MTKNNNILSKEIRGKVSDKLFQWYQQEAKKRNISIEEFLQEIPDIIETLEDDLASAEGEVLDLKGMGSSY